MKILTAGQSRHGEKSQKNHHPHAIVEQGFRGNLRLDLGRGTQRLQHGNDGDGIGGRNQGAQDEAIHQWDVQPEFRENKARQEPDDGRGNKDADGGEKKNRAGIFLQAGHIHLKGTGEKQETQHAPEERRGKVDLP